MVTVSLNGQGRNWKIIDEKSGSNGEKYFWYHKWNRIDTGIDRCINSRHIDGTIFTDG